MVSIDVLLISSDTIFHVQTGGQGGGWDKARVHRDRRRRDLAAGLHRLLGVSGDRRLWVCVPSNQERCYEGHGAAWGAQDHEEPPDGASEVHPDCASLTSLFRLCKLVKSAKLCKSGSEEGT